MVDTNILTDSFTFFCVESTSINLSKLNGFLQYLSLLMSSCTFLKRPLETERFPRVSFSSIDLLKVLPKTVPNLKVSLLHLSFIYCSKHLTVTSNLYTHKPATDLLPTPIYNAACNSAAPSYAACLWAVECIFIYMFVPSAIFAVQCKIRSLIFAVWPDIDWRSPASGLGTIKLNHDERLLHSAPAPAPVPDMVD